MVPLSRRLVPRNVDWSKAEKVVRSEHEGKGYAGRFGPGLPRKNDGSLLFLLHMLSKMKLTLRPLDLGPPSAPSRLGP
jgi:hypothetical protein